MWVAAGGGLTNSRPIPRDAPCTMATPPPAEEKALAATASLAIAAPPPLIGGFGPARLHSLHDLS